MWMRWEQRERKENRETGEAVMCTEFAPLTETRAGVNGSVST